MIAPKLSALKKSALVLGAAVVAMTGVFAAPAHAKKAHVHIHLGIPLGVGGYYGYGYGYGPSCYWLKKKAIYTGSPYWWKKYKQCKYGW
jgi:uncharacterized membrane protein YfcA